MAIFLNESIKVHIISPLVCYGNSRPEIRASSIKGALHWWLRALIGDIAEGKKIENSVLGSTSNSSKLRIKIRTSLPPTIEINKSKPYWRHELFYFNYYIKDKHGYKPGTSFDFKISLSDFDADEANYEEYIYITLEAFSLLGSFGARARRGYGSIVLTYEGENAKLLKALSPINSVDDLKSRIKNIFSTKLKLGSDKRFYCLANAKVYIGFDRIGQGFNSYEKAIADVLNKMKKVRSDKQSSGYLNDIKPLIEEFIEDGNLSSQPERVRIESAGFGFPINYQSRSLRETLNFQNSLIINLGEFERVASPLLIKVMKIKNKYFPLITYFGNDVIQKNSPIKLNFNKYQIVNRAKENEENFGANSSVDFSIVENIPKFVKKFLDKFEPII